MAISLMIEIINGCIGIFADVFDVIRKGAECLSDVRQIVNVIFVLIEVIVYFIDNLVSFFVSMIKEIIDNIVDSII